MTGHGTLVLLEIAPHEGHVTPRDRMLEELTGQAGVGPLVLGHHQQTGGVLVDAVHQTGTHVPLLKQGKILQMPRERIDERTAVVAVSRMHDQSGRLVEHDEVVVLMNDVERNILGDDLHLALGIGHHEGDAVERLHLVTRLHRRAVHQDVSSVGRRLHPASRTVFESHRQVFVYAEHGLTPVYRDGEMLVQLILLVFQLLRYPVDICCLGILH